MMEGVLGFIGFSLGASLGVALVRTASGRLRPLVKGAIKTGLAVGDTVQAAGKRASGAVSTAAGTVQGEAPAGQDASSQLEPARSRRRTRANAQKIEIATE